MNSANEWTKEQRKQREGISLQQTRFKLFHFKTKTIKLTVSALFLSKSPDNNPGEVLKTQPDCPGVGQLTSNRKGGSPVPPSPWLRCVTLCREEACESRAGSRQEVGGEHGSEGGATTRIWL